MWMLLSLMGCQEDLQDNMKTGSNDTVDNDGDSWSMSDGDCDDENPRIHPGADEDCDGIDNDCDGVNDNLSCLYVYDFIPAESDIFISEIHNYDDGSQNNIAVHSSSEGTFLLSSLELQDLNTNTNPRINIAPPGAPLMPPSDLDGDGYDDILHGSFRSGEVNIAYGPSNDLTQNTLILSEEITSFVPYFSMISNGEDDAIIVFEQESEADSFATHSVSFISHADITSSSIEGARTIIQPPSEDCCLVLVDPAGDVNGDGNPDIMVTTVESNGFGDNVSKTSIIEWPFMEMYTFSDLADSQMLDDRIHSSRRLVQLSGGDINKDGYDDLLIYQSSTITVLYPNSNDESMIIAPESQYLIDKAYGNNLDLDGNEVPDILVNTTDFFDQGYTLYGITSIPIGSIELDEEKIIHQSSINSVGLSKSAVMIGNLDHNIPYNLLFADVNNKGVHIFSKQDL